MVTNDLPSIDTLHGSEDVPLSHHLIFNEAVRRLSFEVVFQLGSDDFGSDTKNKSFLVLNSHYTIFVLLVNSGKGVPACEIMDPRKNAVSRFS
jgi:hypothetical protein